jgi:hypothetical protein
MLIFGDIELASRMLRYRWRSSWRYGRRVLPDLDAWDAWPPSTIAARLAGLDLPWAVAAGWALDLFLGHSTRPHDDLEIALPAQRFAEITARFDDCAFFVPNAGVLHPYPAGGHQTWARERATGKWRFDVFREPHDGDVWICRRDPRIRLPYAELINHTTDGIPYVVPEVALLFKAKASRDKDERDFAAVLPALRPDQRRWLDDALAIVHPDHPWRTSIADA